jgi:hypothetical protein
VRVPEKRKGKRGNPRPGEGNKRRIIDPCKIAVLGAKLAGNYLFLLEITVSGKPQYVSLVSALRWGTRLTIAFFNAAVAQRFSLHSTPCGSHAERNLNAKESKIMGSAGNPVARVRWLDSNYYYYIQHWLLPIPGA